MSKTYNASDLLVSVPVPISMLGAVYALLGGVSGVAVARGSTVAEAAASKPEVELLDNSASGAIGSTLGGVEPDASGPAQAGERDAAGTLFDPARHTGTKVKSGLWRLKAGVPRGPGEDLPAGTPNAATAANSPSSGTATAGVASAAAAAGSSSAAVEEDDEFAAFAAAAAPATANARTWTDADLSKLANQAATKLGSPDKVKATIAKHVPEGLTPHSRNIPAEKREAFASELESVAGIEYAG